MGILDWFRTQRKTTSDEAFGELMYEHGAWHGFVPFEGSDDHVSIAIETDGSMPAPQHYLLLAELRHRWAELQPGVGAALFQLWSPYLANWPPTPVVTSVDTILRYTTLDTIRFASDGSILLGYGFTDEVGWPDAMFSVEIVAWTVAPRSLDD